MDGPFDGLLDGPADGPLDGPFDGPADGLIEGLADGLLRWNQAFDGITFLDSPGPLQDTTNVAPPVFSK